MFFHALRMAPLGPFFGLKRISLQKGIRTVRKKSPAYISKCRYIIGNKPWQALPVVNSWAASADCKLHTLIILILYFHAHNTFMHRTRESLSGSDLELKKLLAMVAIWV